MKPFLFYTAFVTTFVLTESQTQPTQLYFAAHLLDEQLAFQERIIGNAAIPREKILPLIKHKDPDIEWKNMRSLAQYEDLIKDRLSHFLNRSSQILQNYFHNTSCSGKVLVNAEMVKEIKAERDKIASEAKRFFVMELPVFLNTFIGDVGALKPEKSDNGSKTTNKGFGTRYVVETSTISLGQNSNKGYAN